MEIGAEAAVGPSRRVRAGIVSVCVGLDSEGAGARGQEEGEVR